jgi:hypothetical protein
MDDEIIMHEEDLKKICVPSFKAPKSLNNCSDLGNLKITGDIALNYEQIKIVFFEGITRHRIGKNKMMSILSVDDITSGRVKKDDAILKVQVKMDDLLTSLSIEFSKDQIEEILEIGLRNQFGSNVESVKVINFIHDLKKYELMVTFKERCGHED